MPNSYHRLLSTALLGWVCAMAMLLVPMVASAQQTSEPVPGDYRVESGRVDRGTYSGWRIFHTTCYGCHGVGAVGTDLAPNLVERMNTLTPRAFATKVLTSYRIAAAGNGANSEDGTGMLDDVMRRERDGRTQVLMPAWENDPSVHPHVLDLYAYLSARADGKIGPEQPRRLRKIKRKPGV